MLPGVAMGFGMVLYQACGKRCRLVEGFLLSYPSLPGTLLLGP